MCGKNIMTKEEWKKLLSRAKKGDPESQWEVGATYEDGAETETGEVVVKRQPKRAFQWFKKSAEQGYADAQGSLGRLFSTGVGVERDVKTAIYWTQKAVKQGCSTSALNMGTIYRDMGKHSKAFYWYNRAVEMGDKDSLLNLGLCYLFGTGTQQDIPAAVKCLDKLRKIKSKYICERTIEDANYWSAVINLLGVSGAKRSVARARKLLETADRHHDHEQANELLNLIGKTELMVRK